MGHGRGDCRGELELDCEWPSMPGSGAKVKLAGSGESS